MKKILKRAAAAMLAASGLAAGAIVPALAVQPADSLGGELQQANLPKPENLLVDKSENTVVRKLMPGRYYAAYMRTQGFDPVALKSVRDVVFYPNRSYFQVMKSYEQEYLWGLGTIRIASVKDLETGETKVINSNKYDFYNAPVR